MITCHLHGLCNAHNRPPSSITDQTCLEEQHTKEWVNSEIIYMCLHRMEETEWEGSHVTPSTRK
jgi:hypothetical protein